MHPNVHLRSRGHTAGLIGMRQVDSDKRVSFSVFFTAEDASVVERIVGAKCAALRESFLNTLYFALCVCVCAPARVSERLY
jgi:hypothetical protein